MFSHSSINDFKKSVITFSYIKRILTSVDVTMTLQHKNHSKDLLKSQINKPYAFSLDHSFFLISSHCPSKCKQSQSSSFKLYKEVMNVTSCTYIERTMGFHRY